MHEPESFPDGSADYGPLPKGLKNLGFKYENGQIVPPSNMRQQQRIKENTLKRERVLRTFMDDHVMPLVEGNDDAITAVALLLAHFGNCAEERVNSAMHSRVLLATGNYVQADTEEEALKRLGRAEGIESMCRDERESVISMLDSVPERFQERVMEAYNKFLKEDAS